MAINAESVSMAWHPHVLTTDMRLSSPKHVHTPASVELKTIETNLPITICSVKFLHQKDFRVITYSLTYLPLLLDTYWNKSRDIFLFMPMMITDNIIHSTSKAICPLFVRRYTPVPKLEGVYWNYLVRPSLRPPVCRRHGFRGVRQFFFGISNRIFMYILTVAKGISLLIFSGVTFKKAAWRQYCFF